RQGLCWWSGFEPFFQGLVEPFDFSLCLWVCGTAVFLFDAVGFGEFLETGFAAFSSSEPGSKYQAVIGEGRLWQAMLAGDFFHGGDHGGPKDVVVGDEIKQVAGVVVEEI